MSSFHDSIDIMPCRSHVELRFGGPPVMVKVLAVKYWSYPGRFEAWNPSEAWKLGCGCWPGFAQVETCFKDMWMQEAPMADVSSLQININQLPSTCTFTKQWLHHISVLCPSPRPSPRELHGFSCRLIVAEQGVGAPQIGTWELHGTATSCP